MSEQRKMIMSARAIERALNRIALQIMESHAGSMEIRSEEGKGTTFTLLFRI